MKMNINGSHAEKRTNFRYRGHGMISCNGSSRLLLDYKAKHPDAYWKILRYLYGEDGLAFTHFKLEMGSDMNTSSGTEPAVKRYPDEKADVRRGAGFQLAADIKSIAPHVTIDMLWWSEPRWVTDAADTYAERYRWYKETLDAAYEEYGLEFGYVSANRNERMVEKDWMIYLSKALKNEKNCPYDYSKIKIVAADECTSWNISEDMLKSKELLDAVDVIGSHYTSFADDNTKRLAEEYGKEIWFSEGSSPMTHSPSTYRYDEGRSGLSGINGVLDIANRIIAMVKCGYMTLYEYQPAVAAYYDGVTYCHKQLINAAWPWNGYYTLDSGYFMDMHFSRFIKKGWHYILDACRFDGEAGGDGHSIVNAKHCYVTACSDDGDMTAVITNSTLSPEEYDLAVTDIANADSLYIWETRGPDGDEPYNENYLRKREKLTYSDGHFKFTVHPCSIVTVTTLDLPELSFDVPTDNSILELPYKMSLDADENALAARGYAPDYTTDEGGAFEIIIQNGERVIMQKITSDIKADEWGFTPPPVTSFGDDRWYNYSVSTDVLTNGAESYAGIGARYILVEEFVDGYALHLFGSGKWILYAGRETAARGMVTINGSEWQSLKLTVNNNTASAYINGEQVCTVTSDKAGFSAGRAALYSSYDNCCFRNILVEAAGKYPYVNKLNDLDKAFSYSEDWEHGLMESFRNYKRTVSRGKTGETFTLTFTGTGIILTGAQKEESTVRISIDGKIISESLIIPPMSERQTFFSADGIEHGEHTLTLTVLSGMTAIDAAQITE